MVDGKIDADTEELMSFVNLFMSIFSGTISAIAVCTDCIMLDMISLVMLFANSTFNRSESIAFCLPISARTSAEISFRIFLILCSINSCNACDIA